MPGFYYLGPWQSDAAEAKRLGATRVRVPPPPATTALDLSPPGNPGRDVGVFMSPRPIPDPNYVFLGRGVPTEIRLNAKVRSAFSSLLGVQVDGASLAHALARLLTEQSDPEGFTAPTGLIPHDGREIRLHFGSPVPEFVQPLQRRGAYWGKLTKRYQRHVDDLFQKFGPDVARKYLGDLLRKYKLPDRDFQVFVPPTLRAEIPGPLPPETIFTDDFNRTSLGPDWVIVSGALVISANRVQPDTSSKNTGYNTGRWASQLSSDDHYVQLELYTGSGSSYGGPLARHDGGSQNHGYYAETLTGGGQKLFRWNAGAATLLHSGSQAFVSGTVRKVECDASTITHYYGTTTIGSVSDASPITGTKYPGLMLYFDSSTGEYLQGDNWEAADLYAGTSASAAQATGFGASTSADTAGSLSQATGFGANADADTAGGVSQATGFGANAVVGTGGNASQATGFGANADADVAGNVSQATGFGASATATVGGGSSASASQAVGLGASTSVQLDGFRFPEEIVGLGASADVVINLAGQASQAVGFGADATANTESFLSQATGFGASASAFVSHPASATAGFGATASGQVQAPIPVADAAGFGAYAAPVIFCGDGRLGIGIVQPQSGTDYPLIRPSEDIRYLLADAHFYFDDPGDYLGGRFTPPLRLDWLYGLGALPSSKPSWAPDPTHDVDLVIRDDDGNIVLDTTTATAFFSREWTPRLHIYAWEGDDYLCWIVVHKCWSDTEDPKISPRDYPIHLTAQHAVLDPRTVFRRGKIVRSISASGLTITSGHVTLQAGYNINLQDETGGSPVRPSNRIEIQAVPGAGLGRFSDCDNVVPLVRRLGMATADQYGYLRIAADDCLTIMPSGTVNGQPVDNGLSIWNICGPRCAPEEFVSLANYMRDISLLYEQLGAIAEQTRDQLASEVQRWNDAVCCQQQYPLRVVAQPQLCPYMDVWGQLVNMTDQCLRNVKVKFKGQITNDTSGQAGALVIQKFTRSKKKRAGSIRNAGTVGKDSVFGSWPDFWITWDEIPPQQDVWVRFRLKFSDCGLNGKKDPFKVKVTMTAEVDGQPLQAENCQTGAPENASASQTVDLKCPLKEEDTFAPQIC